MRDGLAGEVARGLERESDAERHEGRVLSPSGTTKSRPPGGRAPNASAVELEEVGGGDDEHAARRRAGKGHLNPLAALSHGLSEPLLPGFTDDEDEYLDVDDEEALFKL